MEKILQHSCCRWTGKLKVKATEYLERKCQVLKLLEAFFDIMDKPILRGQTKKKMKLWLFKKSNFLARQTYALYNRWQEGKSKVYSLPGRNRHCRVAIWRQVRSIVGQPPSSLQCRFQTQQKHREWRPPFLKSHRKVFNTLFRPMPEI